MRIIQNNENNKEIKRENVSKNDANSLAILFATLGIMTIVIGDGGTYKGFPVPDFIGWIELAAAAAFAILGFRAEQNPYEEKIMICPKCQAVYPPEKTSTDPQCQNCNCSLELLEGFYERNPELKGVPEKVIQHEND